jgi:hypothetical protein
MAMPFRWVGQNADSNVIRPPIPISKRPPF